MPIGYSIPPTKTHQHPMPITTDEQVQSATRYSLSIRYAILWTMNPRMLVKATIATTVPTPKSTSQVALSPMDGSARAGITPNKCEPPASP